MGNNILKRVLNMIFYLILIIIIYFIFIFNYDYKKVNVKSLNDLNKYKNIYINIDLKKASETRFSINSSDNLKSNIYLLNLDGKYLLIELSPSTVLTNNINLIHIKDNNYTKILKNDLNNENNNKYNFIDGYYSNININENLTILHIKVIILNILVMLCMFMIILNFILLFIK